MFKKTLTAIIASTALFGFNANSFADQTIFFISQPQFLADEVDIMALRPHIRCSKYNPGCVR